MNIMLSIIIPVYNVERYLDACLASVARLEGFAFEVLLIDDGASDGSGRLCDEWSARDARFRVIHQENQGVAVARNAGLDVAQGEWIWFVDSDDLICPDALNALVRQDLWQRIAPHDYVLFDLQTFEDGAPLPPTADTPVLDSVIADGAMDKNAFLLRHPCYHHQRLFYKKSWVMINHHQRLRFTRGLRVGEDLEFQYKYLMLAAHPVRMNAVLYRYRLNPASVTKQDTYRMKNVEDLPQVLSGLLGWAKEHGVKPEPWLETRVQGVVQNLLYSASLVKGLDRHSLQATVRQLLRAYRAAGFAFPASSRMRLARLSVTAYMLLNGIYLKMKRP